jgi:hypothetical protein
MSQRVPGFSQQEMIALWKDFCTKSFRRTNFRTTFNGVTRTVYQHDQQLLVLDEYHGDLEVLAFQTRAGEARHRGSQAIDVVYESPRGGGKPIVREVKLGAFLPGGKHKFILTGSL